MAIDDEPIALRVIEEYCRQYGDIELKCFTSPVAGMECVKGTHPDIVFLDIEMNTHNGITLARDLPAETCLIFTTAYASYALEGFNVDAVDFLHKPIFYPRFEKAMAKAEKLIQYKDGESTFRSITVKENHKNVVVHLKDVIVIEAMDNYVKIYRKDMPTVVPQITMKEIEEMLPEDCFVRLHRSFIVSIPYIEKFSTRSVYLYNFGRAIPVGRTYIKAFNKLNSLIMNK